MVKCSLDGNVRIGFARLLLTDDIDFTVEESTLYKRFMKRFLDIAAAILGFAVLAVPMALIALFIKIDSNGPVLFRQKRVGIHKTHFEILKFRTMRTDAPKDAPTDELQEPDKWITPLGGFLRKTSLDELPQLFNILVGHMSFVGPRPALWNQFDLVSERDRYGANDVLPGLTGWAQINGRDMIGICEKAMLDGEYVNRMSFCFDAKCFFCTFARVFRRDGIVEGGKRDA